MSKLKTEGKRGARQPSKPASASAVPGGAVRETIESIAVAVVLAFLFRAFVAEAFVIPTGSMAPTLMGAHKDVKCPECGCWYQTGASVEGREEEDLRQGRTPRPEEASRVVATVCPVCRYPQLLDIEGDANKATFSGDRILVSKFIYDFTQPKRWDVIVFKYPLSAKQNFIKRLIGLPGESVLIQRGDIYIKGSGDAEFTIARKPDAKLEAMLQLVDDTKYISQRLVEVNWPRRWQPWSQAGADLTASWTTDDDGHSYYVDASAGGDHWLRYHHVAPSEYDWAAVRQMAAAGQQVENPQSFVGNLITDFYAYNTGSALPVYQLSGYDPHANFEDVPKFQHRQEAAQREAWEGLYWVGDLALEGEVDLQSDTGTLLLQLTKGGEDFRCAIDIASGMATLSIDDGTGVFAGEDGADSTAPSGQTKIQGGGRYDIRYTNVDAEIRLWVNGTRVLFDGPTTYAPRIDAQPVTSAEDPGDLAPVGIGANGAVVHAQRLRVLRDIYYIGTAKAQDTEYPPVYGYQQIREILCDPDRWKESGLFARRGSVQFDLGPDQFFPMGDNSPQSSDARWWSQNYFERELLIGRALLIYWPHPWYRPIPYLPNVERMKLIH